MTQHMSAKLNWRIADVRLTVNHFDTEEVGRSRRSEAVHDQRSRLDSYQLKSEMTQTGSCRQPCWKFDYGMFARERNRKQRRCRIGGTWAESCRPASFEKDSPLGQADDVEVDTIGAIYDLNVRTETGNALRLRTEKNELEVTLASDVTIMLSGSHLSILHTLKAYWVSWPSILIE